MSQPGRVSLDRSFKNRVQTCVCFLSSDWSAAMCPAWLLVAMATVGVATAAAAQCWDAPSCRDLSSDSALLAPPPDLSDPTSSLTDSAPSLTDSTPQVKRSYSMEHFRWGKPVGRKRRPVKVYTSNDQEEESSEFDVMKRALANQLPPQEAAEPERGVLVLENDAAAEGGGQVLQQKKKNGGGVYKMKHFRWSGPPESKRYGGFMKSWDERSQRPLLTLFKNVINKEQQLPI